MPCTSYTNQAISAYNNHTNILAENYRKIAICETVSFCLILSAWKPGSLEKKGLLGGTSLDSFCDFIVVPAYFQCLRKTEQSLFSK